MTAGIPNDMRRTVVVSLAAHAAVLALLSTVPLVRMPTMGASAVQVMLVSPVALPTPPPQSELQPVEKPAPVPERHADVLQKRIQDVAVPKPIASLPKTPVAAKAEPASKREALAPPPIVKPELTVPKAEDVPAKPPTTVASKLAVPTVAVPPKPRTTDEINKLLGQLPTVLPKTEAVRPPALLTPPAPAVALAPKGATAVPRTAALERCPPKARAYCPLLEAAINRVWNADTDPVTRGVLESAGDSTATIRMVIQPDGSVKNIELSKSSGNDAYDRAVQSVLRELRHLPPLPAEMRGEPFVAVASFTYTKKGDS